jgi:protein CpxP
MKMSKIALIAALITSTGAGVAVAHDAAHGHAARHPAPHMMRGFAGEPPLARLVQKLDLTDEQRQSIRSLLQATKEQRKSLHEEQRANFKESLTVLPDDPAYPAMIEKRKQLAAQAIQQRSDLNVQIYALLTAEQKAQIPTLIEEMKTKMKERRAKPSRGKAETRM